MLIDKDNPVVMFALEWCEFCWSVRKILAQYDIPYRSVDLDSVAYMGNNHGGKLRDALHNQTGVNTLPQIFIGGEFIGGCTELFDELKTQQLQNRLRANQVTFNQQTQDDPDEFLPRWLHPR